MSDATEARFLLACTGPKHCLLGLSSKQRYRGQMRQSCGSFAGLELLLARVQCRWFCLLQNVTWQQRVREEVGVEDAREQTGPMTTGK